MQKASNANIESSPAPFAYMRAASHVFETHDFYAQALRSPFMACMVHWSVLRRDPISSAPKLAEDREPLRCDFCDSVDMLDRMLMGDSGALLLLLLRLWLLLFPKSAIDSGLGRPVRSHRWRRADVMFCSALRIATPITSAFVSPVSSKVPTETPTLEASEKARRMAASCEASTGWRLAFNFWTEERRIRMLMANRR